MSPEQLDATDPASPTRPEDLNDRSDVYSLALVLWEMLARRRPWNLESEAASVTEGVILLRSARQAPLPKVSLSSTPTNKLLIRVLEDSLDENPLTRPSAQKLASRLQVASDAAASTIFEPPAGSLRDRLRSVPFWMLAMMAIVLPNGIAAGLNFIFNKYEIILPYGESKVVDVFGRLVYIVNLTAFPLGIMIVVFSLWKMQKLLTDVRLGKAITTEDINQLVRFARRPAFVGITLWIAAGIVYNAGLFWGTDQWHFPAAVQFMASIAICGLIGGAYPYLLMMWSVCFLHYPRLIEGSLSDPDVEVRMNAIRSESERFVFIAAGVPLTALALLASQDDMVRYALLAAVAAGALGLFFAFRVQQKITVATDVFVRLLGNEKGRTRD